MHYPRFLSGCISIHIHKRANAKAETCKMYLRWYLGGVLGAGSGYLLLPLKELHYDYLENHVLELNILDKKLKGLAHKPGYTRVKS